MPSSPASKSYDFPFKKSSKTPAQDRLKRLQLLAKTVDVEKSDGHDKKKCKSYKSQFGDRLDNLNKNVESPSTSIISYGEHSTPPLTEQSIVKTVDEVKHDCHDKKKVKSYKSKINERLKNNIINIESICKNAKREHSTSSSVLLTTSLTKRKSSGKSDDSFLLEKKSKPNDSNDVATHSLPKINKVNESYKVPKQKKYNETSKVPDYEKGQKQNSSYPDSIFAASQLFQKQQSPNTTTASNDSLDNRITNLTSFVAPNATVANDTEYARTRANSVFNTSVASNTTTATSADATTALFFNRSFDDIRTSVAGKKCKSSRENKMRSTPYSKTLNRSLPATSASIVTPPLLNNIGSIDLPSTLPRQALNNQNNNTIEKLPIQKPISTSFAKSKLKSSCEKLKVAILDPNKGNCTQASELLSLSLPLASSSPVNLANNRLNRLRFNLQQEQQRQQNQQPRNSNSNELILPIQTNISPPNNFSSSRDDDESMDWQSEDSDANLCSDKEVISASGSIGNQESFNISNNVNKIISDSSLSKESDSSHGYYFEFTEFTFKDKLDGNSAKLLVSSRKQNYMYFVLDTNILMHYIVFVKDLTKLRLFDGTVGNILFIPYAVVKELDRHKMRTDTRIAASRAIRFLNDEFDLPDCHIEAQSAREESRHIIQVDNADDSIINCCLQLKPQVRHLTLLTDDGNLMLKSKINHITVRTKSELVDNFRDEFLSLEDK